MPMHGRMSDAPPALPSCTGLQGAPSCWFSEMELAEGHVAESGHQNSRGGSPLPTLLQLEHTIQSRREASEAAQGGCLDAVAAAAHQAPSSQCMIGTCGCLCLMDTKKGEISVIRRHIILLDGEAACRPAAAVQEGADMRAVTSACCFPSAYIQTSNRARAPVAVSKPFRNILSGARGGRGAVPNPGAG